MPPADPVSMGASPTGGTVDVPARDVGDGRHRWAVLPAGLAAVVYVLLVAVLATLIGPAPTLAVGTGAVLVTAVWIHPPAAAYLLVVVTLLTSGVERGVLVPSMRPNEAFAILVGTVLVVRHLAAMYLHGAAFPKPSRLDVAVFGLAFTSSVLPMMWLFARGRAATSDDLLYAMYLWKFLGDYLIVRASVRSTSEVRRCLSLVIGVGSLIAMIAVLQSLNLLGAQGFLEQVFAGDEGAGGLGTRATTTLGSSIATGSLLIYCVGIALTWWLREDPGPRPLLAALPLLTFGVLAAGQFSAAIGLLVCLVTAGLVTHQLRRVALASVPLAVVGCVLLAPVIARRLRGFDRPDGVPPSWLGRWDNLTTYFWPELTSAQQFLLGVRPAARIPATDTWREYVYMESGHTWLIWSGGVPLFLAFVVFTWAALTSTLRAARGRTDMLGTAAAASFVTIVVMNVLMVFDVHLTLRGAGDLLFILLALASVRPPFESAVDPLPTVAAKPAAEAPEVRP